MKSTTISAAIATLQGVKTELEKKLQEAQQAQQSYTGQIEALRALPISLEDFSQYLKKHIELFGKNWFAGRCPPNLLKGRFTDVTATNKKGWEHFEREIGVFSDNEFLMPDLCRLDQGFSFGALCFAVPEAMHEKLMAGYRVAIGDSWGNEDHPTVEQRRATVAELQIKVRTCQTQREALQTSLNELTVGIFGESAATSNNAACVDPAGTD